jgi:hypothetical protein
MSENIYLTFSQTLIDRLFLGHHPTRRFSSNFALLDALAERVGWEKLRLLTPNGMYDSQDQNPADIYAFTDPRTIQKVQEPFETPVLVMIDENGFLPGFSMEEIRRQHEFYDVLVDQGKIGHMINTVAAKETNDKATLVRDFRKYNPILDFPVSNFLDLKRVVEQRGGVVCKHRFGSDGQNFYMARPGNVEQVGNGIGLRYAEFVFQDVQDIESESRIVILGGEVVGARIIEDRIRPWEGGEGSTRKHVKKAYRPTGQEINDSLAIAEQTGIEFGSIDWVVVDGQRNLLEINDAGTGLISKSNGSGPLIYDLSEPFAERIVSYL